MIHDGSWFSFSDWTSHGESTCTEEISRMRHLTLCSLRLSLRLNDAFKRDNGRKHRGVETLTENDKRHHFQLSAISDLHSCQHQEYRTWRNILSTLYFNSIFKFLENFKEWLIYKLFKAKRILCNKRINK